MAEVAALPSTRLREIGGVALVVATALCFTISIMMSRLVYDSGGGAVTLLSARFTAASCAFYLWFLLRGERPWLPWRLALPAIGIGLLAATYTYGYLGAVQYIPVSLAVLIFYLNPVLVGFMAFLFERRGFGAPKAVALVLGLVGVGLALDVNFSKLDWRGLALAFMGANGVALTAVFSQRLLRRIGSLTLAFHVTLVSAVVFVTVGIVGHGFALPQTSLGWWALCIMPFGSTCGTVGFYLALRLVGAVKTSTVMNAEPVFTVLAAVLILQEPFGPLQILGAVLVGTAIFLVSRASRPPILDPPQ